MTFAVAAAVVVEASAAKKRLPKLTTKDHINNDLDDDFFQAKKLNFLNKGTA